MYRLSSEELLKLLLVILYSNLIIFYRAHVFFLEISPCLDCSEEQAVNNRWNTQR
jgi:hypothetical protein